MKLRGPRDFLAGVVFAGIAALSLYLGRDYPMGNALRMGPGYFPYLIGLLLLGLGILIGARGLARPGPGIEQVRVRPLVLVLIAIALFAVTIDRLGIVIAVSALLLVCGLASAENRPRQLFAVTGLLLAFTLAVFVYGLKLPFRVWPL